jgi:hypothetical protein
MTIPNFKTNHDWEAFTSMFDARWHCKKALLDRVKDDLFPGYTWDQCSKQTLEVINDIVQSLLYDVEMEFEEKYPEYKRDGDDIFIPRKNFKEDVTEALKDALQTGGEQWAIDKECPPCDTLACETFLGDHE